MLLCWVFAMWLVVEKRCLGAAMTELFTGGWRTLATALLMPEASTNPNREGATFRRSSSTLLLSG